MTKYVLQLNSLSYTRLKLDSECMFSVITVLYGTA